MQLTYRGVRYDYNPPRVDLKQTEEVGKYRGVDIRFRTVKKNTVQQPTLDLVYRGVAYRTGESVPAGEPTVAPTTTAPVAQSTSATLDKARPDDGESPSDRQAASTVDANPSGERGWSDCRCLEILEPDPRQGSSQLLGNLRSQPCNYQLVELG